jgi:sensor histidine kinase YesM
MNDAVQHLTDHYQKTFELTYQAWKGRNNTFLLLLAAISVSSLIAFPALGTRSLFFLYMQQSLGLNGTQVEDIQRGFPFGMLQATSLFVIFYLTVNLYHRAQYVLLNYAYLGALEGEIRAALGLGAETVAFTRESSFYWERRDPLLGTVKWVYIFLLASLLLVFLTGTVIQDARNGNWLLVSIDVVFVVPTLLYLYAYAASSVKLDRVPAASRKAPSK